MSKSNNKRNQIFLFLSLGILSGALTGIFFVIIQRLLTIDSELSFPDFFILLLSPIIASLIIFKMFNNSLIKTTFISFLTLIIPILGASFGAGDISLINQLGIFSIMGGIGGLIWSIPFSISILLKKNKTDK